MVIVGGGAPDLVPTGPRGKIPVLASGGSASSYPVEDAEGCGRMEGEDLGLDVDGFGERLDGVGEEAECGGGG